MDLKEVDILGADIGKHWYYKSKAKAMQCLLGSIAPKRILDVGAGSGFFSRYLLSHTAASEAWCVDISYKKDQDDFEAGKPVHCRRSVDVIEADLVLLMDVLEHVDHDVEFLRTYATKVPPGSYFILTVPAFQLLWSNHDVFLEHRRRYTLTQLEGVVRNAGLRVEHGAYYYGLVLPLAAMLRLLERGRQRGMAARSQLTKHSTTANAILHAVCMIELSFMRVNRAAGLSVFCLAKKA